MSDFQNLLGNILLGLQMLCALTALIRFNAFSQKIWKFFACYVTAIFLLEFINKTLLTEQPEFRRYYFDFFVIPFEFLFLYWMYSKSLNIKWLFWLCTVLYLLSFLPHLVLFEEPPLVYSFNYVIGNLILLALVCIEFFKQIQTDKIIYFSRNMMFYVNTGVILFYIGSLPFFTFYGLILKEPTLWNDYYIFFMMANSVMYLLFTASFIWGRPSIP